MIQFKFLESQVISIQKKSSSLHAWCERHRHRIFDITILWCISQIVLAFLDRRTSVQQCFISPHAVHPYICSLVQRGAECLQHPDGLLHDPVVAVELWRGRHGGHPLEGAAHRPAGGRRLTRASLGKALSAPSRIFAITWKRRKASTPNFQYLIGHQFDTLSKKT